jgi:hypothetical protein
MCSGGWEATLVAVTKARSIHCHGELKWITMWHKAIGERGRGFSEVHHDLTVRPALAAAKMAASATADMTTCDWPVAGPVRPAPPLGAGGLG